MSDELDLVRRLRSPRQGDEAAILSRVRSELVSVLEQPETIEADARLRSADTILLIDWHPDVPRSLVVAGFEVYSVYRDTKRARLPREVPEGAGLEVLGPIDDRDQRGDILWEPAELPDQIDIVAVYRPAPEQLDLVERF